MAAARRERSGPLHHRKFGTCPRDVAQNINARVGKNVPEVRAALKGNSGGDCEERVEDGESLWKALENREQTRCR